MTAVNVGGGTVEVSQPSYSVGVSSALVDTGEQYEGEYSFTPTGAAQTVPTAGKTLSQDVTIGAIPFEYADVSATTATASDVAAGKVFFNALGTLTEGTAAGSSVDFKALIDKTITTVELPSDLETIGNYAFYFCKEMELSSIPEGVTSIGASAFSDCKKLAITSLPSSVETIGASAFIRCTGLTSISCQGAIGSSGMKTYAFSGCSNLVSASFPNMVQSSLSTVFGSTTADTACQNLEFVDLGKTEAIGANAFANCYKLQTLVLRKTGSVCTVSNASAFTNTPLYGYSGRTATVYVPSSLVSSYKTATNWKSWYNSGYITFSAIEGSQYEI